MRISTRLILMAITGECVALAVMVLMSNKIASGIAPAWIGFKVLIAMLLFSISMWTLAYAVRGINELYNAKANRTKEIILLLTAIGEKNAIENIERTYEDELKDNWPFGKSALHVTKKARGKK